MTVTRYKASRFWAVYDPSGALVCVCVYKRGADEVARRLTSTTSSGNTTVDPDPFWDPNLAYLARRPALHQRREAAHAHAL